MNTAIIILAAGQAKRMGSPKQLLMIEGKTLIKSITEKALDTECFPITVVLGANKEKIKPELDKMPITIVDNPFWEEGMASSIRMGMAGVYLTRNDIEAVIFCTADMPNVSSELLNNIRKVAEENPESDIVACKYANQIGIPVLFKRKIFNELLDLKGDEGAKKVVKKYLEKTILIDFADGEIDLDTKEDYQKFVSKNNQN